MELDVGADPINRASQSGHGYTFIGKENPCNAAGPITKVQIYANQPIARIHVGLFYQTAPNTFSTRSHTELFTIPVGFSEHDVELEAEAGDFIGAYWYDGWIDRDDFGEGYWYWSGMGFPSTERLFTFGPNRTLSLYGWGPETEPPLKHFQILSYFLEPLCVGVLVQVTTLQECHLYMRITKQPPDKHLRSETGRGLSLLTKPDFCFVAYEGIEQEEAGDTLIHTFYVADWGLPPDPPPPALPFDEPWGTYLTENYPWNKYKEPEVPTVTFDAGIIKIENPGYVDCGITYSPPTNQLPIAQDGVKPLKITFNNTEATANSTSSQVLIELIFRSPSEWFTIYLCVACGAEHDDKKPWSTGYVATRPYGWLFVGTGEHTINLLDWFKAFRQELGLSTNPLNWYLNIIAFALGTFSPVTTDHIKNDQIACYLPSEDYYNTKPWWEDQWRYFYFYGYSKGSPMLSTSAIFLAQHPGVPGWGVWDKYLDGEDGFEGGADATSYEAQTIVAEHTHHIQDLTLKLRATDGDDPRGILTIEFRAVDDNHAPTGPVLATILLDTQTVTSGSWNWLTLKLDTILCQNIFEELCFQIHGDGDWWWSVAADTTLSPYPGKEWSATGGGGWVEAPGHTILFGIRG